MDDENYFIEDEELKLIESMTDDELLNYMNCLAIEIEEIEKGFGDYE